MNRHCYLLIPTIIIAATSQAGAKPEVILENSFASVNGSVPYSALKAGDAPYIFYGTTASGGAYGLGAVYEFNSKIGTVIIKDSFDGKNGASPLASLAFGGGGLFYGTAWSGGANGLGSVFEFNSATGLITLKDSFAGSNGSSPYAPLTAAGGGLYYGTICNGGARNKGGVFAFDTTTGFISLKDSFTGSNGACPIAAVSTDGGGLFYGTTFSGGASDYGGVFEFNSITGLITLKGNFTNATGRNSYASLIPAGGGLYYGTTSLGTAYNFGSVFEFESANGSITLMDRFTGTNGRSPYAELISAGDNLYYGTTVYGGANDYGSVFEFNSATGLISILDSFTNGNGSYPYAALSAGVGSRYFGTTALGGAGGYGAIYSFTGTFPVPGPITLLGVGAAFNWSRRLRRRVRRS